MAAHLSHKIRWDYFADYVTPYADHGIALPVGECGRIHTSKKKHQIQVEMRKYISDDMICAAADCQVVGEKVFSKRHKKGKPFGPGKLNDEKLKMFLESLFAAIEEFASTELTTSAVRTVDIPEETLEPHWAANYCGCSEFITCLELGDKRKLFEYSKTDLDGILNCYHGGQAVGHHMSFFFDHLLKFYIFSNVIVYLDLRNESQWPKFMRPDSYFRKMLLHDCDGQTFLPHSRKYLDRAMIDLNETRTLSKNLFRTVYFFVMVMMKFDSSYDALSTVPSRLQRSQVTLVSYLIMRI